MREGVEQGKNGAFVLRRLALAEEHQAIIAQQQRSILVSPQSGIEPRVALGGKQIVNLLPAIGIGGFELLNRGNNVRRNLRGIGTAGLALPGDKETHRNRDEQEMSQASTSRAA